MMVEDKSQTASTARRISSLFLPGNSDKRDSTHPAPTVHSGHPVDAKARGRTAEKLSVRTDTGRMPSTNVPLPPPSFSLPTGQQRPGSSHGPYERHGWYPPMPPRAINGDAPRASSQPPTAAKPDHARIASAPQSPTKLTSTDSLGPDPSTKKIKRKSWMPGAGNKKDKDSQDSAPRAWIAGHQNKLPYDVKPLVSAARVPELWDEMGDTFVYLFPRTANQGPSFKIHSSVYSSSSTLTQLAYGGIYSHRRIVSAEPRRKPMDTSPTQLHGAELPSTPPLTPKSHPSDNRSSGSSRRTRSGDEGLEPAPRQVELYLPISLSADFAFPSSGHGRPTMTEDDLDTLVATRNMFAFLVGQSLISTERRPGVFSIFMKISELLKSYNFTNLDGSTFGEVAASSFDHYVDELGLGDVRASREKTIEGLVLAERMRSVLLYNEAFVHAVGRYDDILQVSRLSGPHAKFQLISPITRSRLERASIDLLHREKSINLRLQDFDFPSVFAGIMNSKTADERKQVRFGAWKEAFIATRKHVLSYYKQKFGSWPPRASSKKNSLETSGLNRLVLRVLYHDFSKLYDLYVDRTNLTTRSTEVPSVATGDDDPEEPIARALRRVFDEYDRSSPPIQPPVPFDTPLVPHLTSIKPNSTAEDLKRDSKARNRRLRDEEVLHLLDTSVNADTVPAIRTSSFLSSMRVFEKKEARGGSLTQLVDLRCGMFIFLYVVLQSLPMLVVDAPEIRFHDGVEYFLCQPPRSGVPWANAVDGVSSARGKKNWYGVSGSTGVVSLPSDLVEHGVEGVYRRSHCWTAAMRWSAALQPAAEPAQALRISSPSPPVLPMPPVLTEEVGGGTPVVTYGRNSSRTPSRQPSPAGRATPRDSVVALGLEALPLPAGVSPTGADGNQTKTSSAASTEPSRTFDDIISGIEQERKGRRDSGK